MHTRSFLVVLCLISFTCSLWLGLQISPGELTWQMGTPLAVNAQSPKASQLVQQGIERYQSVDLRGAIERWYKALDIYQQNNNRVNAVIVRENLARAYQQLGQPEQAISHWNQVIAYDPLRRRFTFVELMPNPMLLGTVEGVDLKILLTSLNQRITMLIGREYQIGHSYFINVKDVAELHFAWYHRVIPLLQEYFYDDAERLRIVLGDRFVQPAEFDINIKKVLKDFCDLEKQYSIKVFELHEDFLKALQERATF